MTARDPEQEIGSKVIRALEVLEEYEPFLTDEYETRLRKLLERRALDRMERGLVSSRRAPWPHRRESDRKARGRERETQ